MARAILYSNLIRIGDGAELSGPSYEEQEMIAALLKQQGANHG